MSSRTARSIPYFNKFLKSVISRFKPVISCHPGNQGLYISCEDFFFLKYHKLSLTVFLRTYRLFLVFSSMQIEQFRVCSKRSTKCIFILDGRARPCVIAYWVIYVTFQSNFMKRDWFPSLCYHPWVTRRYSFL